MGVGFTFRITARLLPIWRAKLSARVTEYEPPHKMSMETTEGAPFLGKGSYMFEPIEGGTRLTFDGAFEMRGFLKLFEPLMGSTARKQTEGEIRKLKELLEGQQ